MGLDGQGFGVRVSVTSRMFYFLVLHPVARNITIPNGSTTFHNQIMRVHFIILHCTTCFSLQAGHHQVLSDNIMIKVNQVTEFYSVDPLSHDIRIHGVKFSNLTVF
jgi:hypothetical protein